MATKETTLTLPNISCNHCVQRITQMLTNMAGVTSIQVDLPTKTATFVYDSQIVQLEALKARLDEAGYPVQKPPLTGRGKPLSLR
jgi:copper chaperone